MNDAKTMSNKGCFQGNWGDFLTADPWKLFQKVDASIQKVDANTSSIEHEMSG